MLLRNRTIVATTLSLIIFTASISVLMGIGSVPKTMLGGEDVFVITSKDSNSILNSRIDASLADRMLALEFVTNASPEIFTFAEIDGSAVIVRGVDLDQFIAVEGAILVSGAFPSLLSEGLVGSRLAERVSISIGDRIPLVGSYDPSVGEVEITGIIEGQYGINDELIVSLPLARCLSGTSHDFVSIVRLKGDTTTLEQIFGTESARFSIYDLAVPEQGIVYGTETTIRFKVKNWGDIEGTAHVRLTDKFDGSTLLDVNVSLSADESTTLSVNHSFMSVGEHRIRAQLYGSLPQNITTNVIVRAPFLTLIAPQKVIDGQEFVVQVVNHLLSPVNNSLVEIESVGTYFTNATGGCLINESLDPDRTYQLTASRIGYESGSAEIEVVNSSSLPAQVLISVYDLTLDPGAVKVRQNCTIAVYVQNLGSIGGSGYILTYFDMNLLSNTSITLEPLETAVLYYNVSFTTAGERAITSGSISKVLSVETVYELNPELIEFLMRYGGEGSLDPSTGQLIYSTAKISEGNIVIVLVSLAILSAMLVMLGISISFVKEINDNMRVIGILRAIGASSRQLLSMIFKKAFLLSVPATILGLMGGILLSYLIAASDSLIAFGRMVEPVLNPDFVFLAVIGSISICLGSSLIAGLSVSRRIAIRMIRGQRDLEADQPTLTDIIGED